MLELLKRFRTALNKDLLPAEGNTGDIFSPFDHSRIINFIWIRNKPQSKDDLSDPLPEKYVNNLLKAARNNPDCSVVLWVDESHWNQFAWQKLKALCSKEDLPNLTLGLLPKIPEYRTDKLFTKTHKGFYDHTDPIWQKVDFARVMVLAHLLKTTDAEQVFYADLDLSAPPILSSDVQAVMGRHGMVFACDNRAPAGYGILENQFMGFARKNAAFVSEDLVPMTRNAISNGMDGWQAMCQAAREKLGTSGPGWLDTVTVRTLEIH